MKTIKKITLVALMLGTLIGYANEDKISTNNKAKRTVKVEFNNVKKGQSLTIKNEDDLTAYNNEITSSGNYSRTFDISALEDGIYSVELNKDFEVVNKTFYVKNSLATFLNNKDEKIFKYRTKNSGFTHLFATESFRMYRPNPLEINKIIDILYCTL